MTSIFFWCVSLFHNKGWQEVLHKFATVGVSESIYEILFNLKNVFGKII